MKGALSETDDAAESCLHEALAIARRQGARPFELRAATAMARRWMRRGREAEARALVSDVYNWFSEGYETGDLRDAKSLAKRKSDRFQSSMFDSTT